MGNQGGGMWWVGNTFLVVANEVHLPQGIEKHPHVNTGGRRVIAILRFTKRRV